MKKAFVKFLATLTVLTIALSVTATAMAADSSITLKLFGKIFNKDDIFSVDIVLKNESGITGLNYVIDYNSEHLQLVSYENRCVEEDFLLSDIRTSESSLLGAFFGKKTNVSGTMASMEFKVITDEEILSDIVFRTVSACDSDANTVSLSSDDGCVFLNSLYSYDISNGEVTITSCNKSAKGDIVIPSTIEECPVTSISGAFYGCEEITSVTIPDSVTNIDDIFAYCKKLEKIIVDENNPCFSSDSDGVLYNKNKTVLIRYPMGKTNTTYEISDSVQSVGNSAFHNCKLKSVIIGDSVRNIDSGAFCYCSYLTSVIIGENVSVIDEWAFNWCNSLTEIKLPDGLTDITCGCFSYCTRLEKITIPDSVKIIDDHAFDMCTELKDVYFNGTENQWNSIWIGDDNFYLTGLDSIGIDGADIHFAEIRFKQDNYNINYKGSLQILAETNIKTDKKINYVTDDPSVLVIDDEGNVSIVGVGTATVTATIEGTDISDTCTITVSYTWWQWIIVIVLFGWLWY